MARSARPRPGSAAPRGWAGPSPSRRLAYKLLQRDRLDTGERFLDALARPLARQVARMTDGAAVDARGAAGGVLGDMRRRVQRPPQTGETHHPADTDAADLSASRPVASVNAVASRRDP
jgi:hypothetical protein